MERIDAYIKRWCVVAIGVSILGCISYDIETTLEPDGSGIRQVEVVVDESGDQELRAGLTDQDFVRLMNLSERQGWKHTRERRDGDEVHVFRREIEAKSVDDWAQIGGLVDIRGALAGGSADSVGYVAVDDVRFRNWIGVELRDGSNGRTLVYREWFEWTDLLDALVEQHVSSLKETFSARYPDLGPERLGELIGLYRAGFWWAIDRGLLDAKGPEGEQLVAEVGERVAYLATEVTRQRYPDAEKEFFAEAALRVLGDGDDEVEAIIDSKLPGARLAGNARIVVRLHMPGRVTDSNAHDRDGSTLKWEISPWDAAGGGLELYAESVTGNQ